ncbi:MAG TPA: hypothetical protein DCY88_07720 [Cyanobacteria bacterium UBA11372]|nr:hypothetical protein [Cyanobacteria bacterium UBA11372]
MAFVLKPGKTYTDRYGHSGASFYAVISRITDVNKNRLEALFTVDIYLSKETAKTPSLYPIENRLYTLKGEDFEKWYSRPLAQNQGLDPYKQLYLYLESVVDPETKKFAWEDWQSDEVL